VRGRETEFRQTNGRAEKDKRNYRADLEKTRFPEGFDIHSSTASKSILLQIWPYRMKEIADGSQIRASKRTSDQPERDALVQNSEQFITIRPRQISLRQISLHFSWTANDPQTGQITPALWDNVDPSRGEPAESSEDV
jgi:hypothetical protein